MPDVPDLGLVLLGVPGEELEILPDPPENGGLGDNGIIELLDMVHDLPLRDPLEVEIQGEGHNLRVVLHPAEPLIDYKGEVAGVASVPLDGSILRLSAAPFRDVHALAERAGYLWIGLCDVPGRALLLYLVLEL